MQVGLRRNIMVGMFVSLNAVTSLSAVWRRRGESIVSAQMGRGVKSITLAIRPKRCFCHFSNIVGGVWVLESGVKTRDSR